MSAVLVATVGHGATSLWYLTRATGLVSLVLLSATVVLGVVASVGWTRERWPRFLSQAVHRNLSLFCLALIVVHVVTTVADGYVPIGFADAIIPFRSPYRPLWVGLGAFAFDLLLAVAITSAVRRRIGVRAWRLVHWLAYLCWPVALVHGLGAGSDSRLSGALVVYLLCVASVVGSVGWRLVAANGTPPRWRLGAATTGLAALVGVAVFAITGPWRPGWSHRAGTSSAVLAQLSAAQAAGAASSGASAPSAAPSTTPTTIPPQAAGAIPASPFSSAVSGTFSVTGPDTAGQVQVVLSMRLQSDGLSLVVTLDGPARQGGVAMTSSNVVLGSQHGAVTFLQGSTIGATVSGSGRSERLTLQLNLDRATDTLTGTVAGTAGAVGDDGGGTGR